MHVLLPMLLACLQDTDRPIRELSSEDPAVRDAAVESILKAGVKAIPAVATLLDSEDPEVASRALGILKRFGLSAWPVFEASGSRKLKEVGRQIAGDVARGFLKEGGAFSVQWHDPPAWDRQAEVETGSGSGHGFTLSWNRFHPKGEDVEILSVTYSAGRKPYDSTWPPDDAPVTARKAGLNRGEYAAMLQVLATLEAATLNEKKTNHYGFSTGSFYAYIRVARPDQDLFREEYAGYPGTQKEPQYAKAQAAAAFVTDFLKSVPLKDQPLGREDRAWVSERFARDWKRVIPHDKFYGWVQERLLILVGAAGDDSALPLLAEVIRDGDPKDRKTYYAINAATRLLGKDVRDKPLEEMDVLEVKRRILPLLERK
jgi:hypothetical protein